jgi:YHS domain-containing protein
MRPPRQHAAPADGAGHPALILQRAPDEEERMERDPVCGMQVDPQQSAYTSDYQGRTYYFCSEHCKRRFDEDPVPYAAQETGPALAGE